MGLNIKTIFDIVSEEEIDKSFDERKRRKDELIKLFSIKIDKLTDEEIDDFINDLKDLN